MSRLKKLLMAVGFGLGALMITYSLGATPSTTAEDEISEGEEEEEQVQKAQEKSPTDFYDYDAASKEAGDAVIRKYNIDLVESKFDPSLKPSVTPWLIPPTEENYSHIVVGKDHQSTHEEHGTLRQHLNAEVGEHPPADEEEEKTRKGKELTDEVERERNRRK